MADQAKSGQLVIQNNLWSDGRKRGSLPIDDRLDEIIRLSRNNKVVIVEADTGSGKTTRIPQAFLLADQNLKIWMTSLRRNAVRSIGAWIASEMGCQPGELVGWRLSARGGQAEKVVSPQTRLTMMVDQSLANWIVKSGKLPEGLIIVDEAHDRNVAIDQVLGLIKLHLPQSPDTRVLITSATIDTKKFSEFFDNAPVVSVPGRCFPVEAQVCRLGIGEHHSQGAAHMAKVVLREFVYGRLMIEDRVVTDGTVIVLLPGKDDIDSVAEAIEKEIEELGYGDCAEVMKLFGGSSPQEDAAVQAPVAAGKIRFVCATEVLRSQRTISGVIGVIDSLQIKRKITTPQGAGRLKKIAVSKAEADQGKGRAGRTCSGFYIAISFEHEYENLEPYPMPAILREPITSVVLQLAHTGISVREFPFIDKPTDEHIEVAISRLVKMGALNEEEKITELGRLLLQFPVDPESAMALVTADKYGVLAEAIVASAIRENEGIKFLPKRNADILADEWMIRFVVSCFEKKSYGGWMIRSQQGDMNEVDLNDLPTWAFRKGKLFTISGEKFPSNDGARYVYNLLQRYFVGSDQGDFAAYVRMYRAYKTEERRLKAIAREHDSRKRVDEKKYDWKHPLRQWCQARFLNLKKLEFVDGTIAEIKAELINSPLNLQNGIAEERDFDVDALTKSLMSGMVDNIAVFIGGRNYFGAVGEVSLAFQSACNGERIILVGHPVKIPTGRGGFFYLVNEAAPIEYSWLEEVLPKLCSRQRLGDFVYCPDKDEVQETEVVYFLDQAVAEERVMAIHCEEVEQCFVNALSSGQVACVQRVVDRNAETRREYERLWIRSGGIFKRLTETDEYEVYARELIGKGIVSAYLLMAATLDEQVDTKNLFLPLVPDDERERVELENPETVEVDGQVLAISYSKDFWSDVFSVKTEVSETLARQTSFSAVTLLSGRPVQLVCGSYSAMNFPDLVEMLEAARIAQLWTEARRQFETRWVGEIDVVANLLARVGREVIVANANDGAIVGFVGLKVHSGGTNWMLFLTDSREVADEETQAAIEPLFKASVKDALTVPVEEPWYEGTSYYRNLTDLGSTLQAACNSLLFEHIAELTAKNFSHKVQMFKLRVTTLRSAIIREHEEARLATEKGKIASTEASVQVVMPEVKAEAPKGTLADSLAALKNKFKRN